MPVFGQTRAALAAAAARGADILSSLRLVMTAEALTAPVPAQALELNTELEVLCDACRELAACRGGWLYLCPAEEVQPAALPRGLLHGVVLSFLRGVLRSGGRAVIRVLPYGEAAVLTLQGGRAGQDARGSASAAAPLRCLCHDRGRRTVRSGGAHGPGTGSAAAGGPRTGRAAAGPLQRAKGLPAGVLRGGGMTGYKKWQGRV